MRESLEDKFCDEKKELIRRHSASKRDKLKQVMQRQPSDASLQDIGRKLVECNILTTEGGLTAQVRIKEQNLEKV